MKLQDFINKYGNVTVDEKELKELLGVKGKKHFIPNVGERYFVVSRSGEVDNYANDSTYDAKVFENSEVFKTKEEAEEHAKKQRFLLKMKRDFLDNSDDIDWENNYQRKYNIYYSHYHNSIKIEYWTVINYGIPVTTNRKWLEEYIEKYEEEIKKYYFEIEED